MKPTPIWSQQSWSQQSMYEGLDEEAENGPNQSGRSVDRLCLRLSFALVRIAGPVACDGIERVLRSRRNI
jgi:hypothetical protein